MQKRKRKEDQGTKSQEGGESILKLVSSAFSIGAAFWLWKKKGTLMIVFWLASFFKSNLWNHSSREQIRPSPTEIHRLHKNLENLEELPQSQTQELLETKSEPTPFDEFDERLAKKEEKIESLEERIGELNLEATKHNLTIDSYQKDAKESGKKLQEKINQINQKETDILLFKDFILQKVEELQNSQKKLETTRSELRLIKNSLQEKREQSNRQEFKIENFKIQAKKEGQLIQELQEKLKEKENQFFQSNQELVEARQEIKGLIDKLQASERRGKGQRIFYALDLILNSRIFRRI